MILTLTVLGTAICDQACGTPLPSASDCPQHPSSGNVNCCRHTSNDAAVTSSANCPMTNRTSTPIAEPIHSEIAFLLWTPIGSESRVIPPDTELPHSVGFAPSILRV